jgi:hypothetical protein
MGPVMRLRSCAAVAALAFAAAQPAAAAIITVTATGTLSSGFDQSGLFGSPNTDLTGAVFSTVYTYDTANGVYEAYPNSEAVSGGIHQNNTIPSPGSAVITVNGVTATNSGNVGSLLVAGSGNQYWAEVIQRSWSDHVTVEDSIDLQGHRPAGTGLFDSWHSDCSPDDMCRGSFYFTNYYYNTNPGSPAYYLFVDTGQFNVDSIDVVVSGYGGPGAVPEPETWALMIAGFGMAGASLRHRRKASAA